MTNPELTEFAQKILDKRENHLCSISLKEESKTFLTGLIEFLFPHFSNETYYTTSDVLARLQLLERNLVQLLNIILESKEKSSNQVAQEFFSQIPETHDLLWADANTIFDGDPAAESIDEVILAYPGFIAITIYRISHLLYKLKVPLLPRIMTEYAHQITGIDIHPGAEIGSPFFIDHGTGIVIGETAMIGKNVKIYQGVTLGALSVDKSLKNIKRHPTIQDNVIIYSQAVILGGDTVIGSKSIIGGNTWVTQSVPSNSLVLSKMEVKVRSTDDLLDIMDFNI